MILNELKILLEMSYDDAIDILKRYVDVDLQNLSDEELSRLRRKLAAKYHPDKGQHDDEVLRMINAALDILKSGKPSHRRSKPQRPSQRQNTGQRNRHHGREAYSYPFEQYPDQPVWSWAGWSGGLPNSANIYRNDFSDNNYLKKWAWEISGKKIKPSRTDLYTFWQFDGKYGRSVISVFGKPQTIKEIAEAFLEYCNKSAVPYKSVAIVVTHELGITIIPLIDGKVTDNKDWILGSFNQFAPDAGNRNPFNDPNFADVVNGAKL